ncbi:MAG: hypothetical protein PHS45_02090 [Bacilli bacterium]|nr:hypothetical protein [Bacilli bacterium]
MNNEFNSNLPPANNNDEFKDVNSQLHQTSNTNNFFQPEKTVENNNMNMSDPFQQASMPTNNNMGMSDSFQQQTTTEAVNPVQQHNTHGSLMENGLPTTSSLPNNNQNGGGTDNAISNNQPQPSKKKSGIGGTIVMIIVLLGFAAAIGYIYWLNKPKNIFLTFFNNTYNDFYTYIEQYKSDRMKELSKNNVITYNTNIKFNANMDKMSELDNLINKLNINYILGVDQKNEKMSFKLDTKFDKEELINLELYNYSNLLYLYVDEALDKYIQIDNVDPASINNEETKSEIIYLIEKIKGLFISSLKDEYFSKEDEGIIINNQTVDTKKTTLIINDKRLKEILTFIINGLKNDNRSIKAIITIKNSNMSETELLKKLDELLEKYKKPDLILDGEISLDIYSKGLFNEVVKYNLIMKYKDDSGELKDMRFSYIVYREGNQDVKEIIFKEGIISKAGLLIKVSDNKTTYDLQLYDNNGGETINSIFDIQKEITEVIIDKEFNYKTNINILIKDNSDVEEKKINIGIIIDTNVIVGGELEEIDASKIVNIKDLTEEEKLMIMMKYFNIFNLLPIEYNPLGEI